MPGRVMGLPRDRFSALQADLLRELQAWITVREEAFGAIVVAGEGAVGDIADRLRLGQLILRRLQWSPTMLLLSFLPRRWRW